MVVENRSRCLTCVQDLLEQAETLASSSLLSSFNLFALPSPFIGAFRNMHVMLVSCSYFTIVYDVYIV